MLPFKKILCPTDFSEPALEALKAASELAQHFSASLAVVHVVPPIPVPYRPIAGSPVGEPAVSPVFDVTSYLLELTTSAKKAMEDLVNEHVPKDLPVNIVVSAGDPAMEINKLAKEQATDLIVIATHGQRGWRRFLFGSVAENVMRLAEGPVLTIHRPHLGSGE